MLPSEKSLNSRVNRGPEGQDTEISVGTVDQIQNLILDSADFEEFLNELARFSAHQVAGDGDDALCGITLLRDRKAATIGWSSDSAREVDEIQYSLSQGPCLTAAEEEREVHVPDLFDEDRWGPDYADAVASHGLRSVLSLPFHLQGDAKAALNLYSDVPHKFDETSRPGPAATPAKSPRRCGWQSGSRCTQTAPPTCAPRLNPGPSSTSPSASSWRRTAATSKRRSGSSPMPPATAT